jgi:uncharacterized protein
MAERSPFVVNVADLLRPDAPPRSVDVRAPAEWSLELSRTLPDPPLVAVLELAAVGGGLLARGTVRVTVEHVCHRCLDPIVEELDVNVAQLYADPALDEDPDYELAGDEIDLEPMIRDEVLLAMPLLPVCGDDCPGTVPGAPEVEDADTSGSPFAALRDLWENESP